MKGKDYIWTKEYPLVKHKFFDIQFGHWVACGNIFNFDIDWTYKCDHAGFEITLNLLGYHFIVSIRDKRHWDDEKDTWES